jgi:alkylhydroperoxidase/carboxymuconolactone decarboxylase family protein YurZ
MMLDWNEYHKQIGAALRELMKLSPDTVRGYQTLGAANSTTSKLGEKTRQLISLAALKAGATKEEIAEALGVAVSMSAGAALVYSTRVLDAMAAKSSPASGS